MTPEEKARMKIDQWLAEAGWKVINREEMCIRDRRSSHNLPQSALSSQEPKPACAVNLHPLQLHSQQWCCEVRHTWLLPYQNYVKMK